MRATTHLLLALLFAAGCGTRSPLTLGGRRPVDAGPLDGSFDAGPDAGMPPDGGPDGGSDGGMMGITLDCGRADRYTAPRQPIRVEADVQSASPITTAEWSLDSAPGSGHRFDPSGLGFSLAPDVPGDYLLTLRVANAEGAGTSCSVTVHSIVGPPVAICPEEPLFTTVAEPLELLGEGFDDDGVIRFRWELVTGPGPASLEPVDQPVSVFRSGTLGAHLVRLTVVDIDGAADSCEVTVQVTGPPRVMCPGSVSGPTRQPITLTASATDDVGIASRGWRVLERPDASTSEPAPRDQDSTRFTPDRTGLYLLEFSATDIEGFTESCVVEVTGLPSPPEVTCPAEIDTEPLTAVQIMATAVDDGVVVRWSWSLTNGPDGSTATPAPASEATTRLTPDIAGVYEVTVVATDDDGLTGQCTTIVNAGNVDGVRVEMFWDRDTGDMDLHLLNNEATGWAGRGGDRNDDCYYSNCNTRGSPTPVLDWYGPADEDDPRLDIDDVDGRGPENINIFRPRAGTYRVGVHGFSGGGDHPVTVRIYCGGSTTTPRQTYGPVNVRDEDLWRVVDVTVSAAGGCTLTDLSTPQGPDVRDMGATGGMR